tara:strand:+ start:4677 stop:5450 length:774 start_codon:yes stop_codon:yes gene_type:complete
MFYNKRIIGSITLKKGRAVQSFRYKNYLPLGSAKCLAENLDRWAVDEILILDIDRSENNLPPNFDLIKSVSSIPIATPLIYAGGIKNVSHASNVIASGAERIVLDSLLINNPELLKDISEAVGVQSIISSVPVVIENDRLHHYDYLKNKSYNFTEKFLENINKYTSELLLIDVLNQGYKGKFNMKILKLLDIFNLPIIFYGGLGISPEVEEILKLDCVNAVAFGNSLNYFELPIKKLRDLINLPSIRKPELLSEEFI